jgi:hypothetical protein
VTCRSPASVREQLHTSLRQAMATERVKTLLDLSDDTSAASVGDDTDDVEHSAMAATQTRCADC